MNELLFIGAIVLAFPCVALVGKFFGKCGLVAWIAIATILANILTAKQITLFGLDVTLGNVMFSSTYLATDILSERCGLKVARKAVNIGALSALVFIVTSQYCLLFTPNAFDFVNESMKSLFAISFRTTSASVILFYLANLADVYLFEKIKQKLPSKLWVRNNVATIVCNCTENFLFMLGAFLGIMTFKECLMLALTTSVVEAIVGVCDTPFVYLGVKWFNE